jgi:hypothetical protein
MAIPPVVHFCWIGPRLPWAYGFALLSAAANAGLAVVLHHTDALEDGPIVQALAAAPGLRLHHLDPVAYLAPVQENLGVGSALTELYANLPGPVQRSDILRAAILYVEGGIYIDMDTVTVAPLTGLLEAQAFIGAEQIVWPHSVYRSRSPLVWAKHLALDVLRKALRLAPGGWRGFRTVQGWYVSAVNNAVMGGEPEAPLFADALRAFAALPAGAPGPYALGPDLYQSLLETRAYPGLVVHPPARFYPLPPEISEHWFRPCRRAGSVLAQVLLPETLVVHWYGSVRNATNIARISPASVRELAPRQLYSALVQASLRALPRAD